MFKALGVLVALYAIYAVFRGEVYARAGAGVRLVSKEDSAEYFWVVVIIYFALSLALITIF
ncbi:MAG: hypothetical protein ACREKR_03835 [Candidatus Methylomirabilales bacterium]